MRGARAGALIAAWLAAAPAAAEVEVQGREAVDLVGLVELLAGEREAPSSLARRALSRFSPWREHAAVARFKLLRERGLRGLQPSQWALYLGVPQALRPLWPVPEHFARLSGGRAELEAFRGELSELARASGWPAWRRGEEEAFAAAARPIAAALAEKDLEAPVVSLLGLKLWRRMSAVPSPFYPRGSHSAWIVEETRERPEVFTVVGAGGPPPDPATLGEWLWPEALYTAAYALWELCRPAPAALKPGACAGPAEPESCVGAAWVDELRAALSRREFGRPAPKTRNPAARRAVAGFARRETADVLAEAERLWRPFLRRPFSCRLPDRGRFQERVYARRAHAAALAVLERRPEEPSWKEAARELSELVGRDGDGRDARQ